MLRNDCEYIFDIQNYERFDHIERTDEAGLLCKLFFLALFFVFFFVFKVFVAKRSEMNWVIKRSNSCSEYEDDCCVRLRGLPFGCSKEEIMNFFSGMCAFLIMSILVH